MAVPFPGDTWIERERARTAEFVRFPGLNHLFQPATTGAVQEYAGIETTIDPAVLTKISSWLLKVTGLDAKG